MKKLKILLVLSLVSVSFTFSQETELINNYPNRYRLDLPKEWLTPRIINTITYILPNTITELKDKDFTTSGKAGYFVRLHLDSFSTTNKTHSIMPDRNGSVSSSISNTTFHFKAVLRVYDSTGNPVSQLLIVSPEEDISNVTKNGIGYTSRNGIIEYGNIYDETGTQIIATSMEIVPLTFNDPSFITTADKPGTSLETTDFIMNVCKQNLFKIKKMLKKLSESGQL